MLCAALTGLWWMYSRQTYSTDLGEQRSISLADGSTVDLNSQSRVRVRFDKSLRAIELLRGEALFHVAKDSARPFIVRSADATVRAVGTVFDVYQKRGAAVVTVVEGVVVVERQPINGSENSSAPDALRPEQATQSQPPRVRLGAGKQAIIKSGAGVEATPASAAAAIAWTQRQLIFEFTPLAEVAEQFNRYNARQLVIEGPLLREFKVSAIFRSTEPGSLVRFVQSMPGVRVTETEDKIVLSPARD